MSGARMPGTPGESLGGALALFVITRGPIGQTAGGAAVYGDGSPYVAREHVWRGTKSFAVQQPLAVTKTVEEARAAIFKRVGRGVEKLLRQMKDGPELVECWGSPLVVQFLRHQGRLT